jgi:hypothetical protein
VSRPPAPSDFDPHEIEQRFREVVNLSAAELEEWLATPESRAVGQKDASGESVGRRSGRRIVEILSRGEAPLTDADLEHMRRVVGFVRRHVAQRPHGDVRDTRWRWSLLNWGHDPLRGPGDA